VDDSWPFGEYLAMNLKQSEPATQQATIHWMPTSMTQVVDETTSTT